MGNYCDLVFTNSSWTNEHILNLWKKWNTQDNQAIKLYPPCSVSQLIQMPSNKKELIIMSFAQFRPEKDQEKQIRIFDRVLQRTEFSQQLKFYIVGSCRNSDDEKLLAHLKSIVFEKKLENKIVFIKNPPYQNLLEIFNVCSIGLHTMEAEHFGIAVVEMMAAGLITIAHNSAGPKQDIIIDNNYGFLCQSEDQYVESVIKAIQLINNKEQSKKLIDRAKAKAQSFSDEKFIELTAKYIEEFLNEENFKKKNN